MESDVHFYTDWGLGHRVSLQLARPPTSGMYYLTFARLFFFRSLSRSRSGGAPAARASAGAP
eukprot:9198367-Pyramimonas_sp.AAC.1